jgi:hypothetical protein
MDTYRFFILDQDDNLVTGLNLHAGSDEEALDWGNFVLHSGRTGELWCGTRYVGRVLSAGPMAASTGLGVGYSEMFSAA